MSKTVLVTGANGFVGHAVVDKLISLDNITPIAAMRLYKQMPCEVRTFDDFSDKTQARALVKKADCVIHCAARVHMMKDDASDPLTVFRRVNTRGTLELATQAAEAGVKRFIFISTIKVLGEATDDRTPFTYDDPVAPLDPYGMSKAEAEVQLQALAKQTGMELVIIRPPLVYGPGVKANFLAMLNLTKKNLPLPLGAINNKRSLVALDNLVDLITICIDHPRAANQVFLVSDDQDVSTTELLTIMTHANGKHPRFLPISVSLLRLAARLIGKQSTIEKLCDSLQINVEHTKKQLDWRPSINVEQGIDQCVRAQMQD